MLQFKSAVFYGGVPIKDHKDLLKNEPPHSVVGTPGRIQQLIREGDLKLDKVKHFVLDECDQMLEALDMRRDVQEIFKKTPREKQVMFFSATLSTDIRAVCKKFMQDVRRITNSLNPSRATPHWHSHWPLTPPARSTGTLCSTPMSAWPSVAVDCCVLFSNGRATVLRSRWRFTSTTSPS